MPPKWGRSLGRRRSTPSTCGENGFSFGERVAFNRIGGVAGLGAAFFLLAAEANSNSDCQQAQAQALLPSLPPLPQLVTEPEGEGGAGSKTTALGVAEVAESICSSLIA